MKAGFSEVNSRIDTLEKVIWRVIWPLIILLAAPIFGLLYKGAYRLEGISTLLQPSRGSRPNEQTPTRPVNLWCSYFFVLAATLQLCSWEPLCAQQRDPAVEIYGLMGTYYFGNSQNVLKNREWKPQVGVGALFPVGSKWALMIDVVTSRLEVNEGPHGPYTDHSFSEFYRVNPGVQNNDLTTQRLIAILPSFVRLWRRDRFSIYAGGGLGLEHQRQHIRYQQAFPQENPDGSTTLVREEEFVDSRDAVSVMSLNFRAGILLNLAPRVVLRGGYSHIITYLDTPASKSLEVGIGYRF